MKPVTFYKPARVQEATQILAHHGLEAAVYAGGTDLLVRPSTPVVAVSRARRAARSDRHAPARLEPCCAG
jgi:CO/xanthine dehydrogenase FAD-binding subunit